MSFQPFSYWGVARFNYVLVTNSNPVMTCASDGRVNPELTRALTMLSRPTRRQVPLTRTLTIYMCPLARTGRKSIRTTENILTANNASYYYIRGMRKFFSLGLRVTILCR
jgi:hypothetical protein